MPITTRRLPRMTCQIWSPRSGIAMRRQRNGRGVTQRRPGTRNGGLRMWWSCGATSLVPEGTILTVVRSGILAHTVPFAVAGRPLTFNQDIKAIQVTDNRLTNDYVFWFLRSKEPEILSRGVKKGATVHSVQSGFLEKLRIPLLSKSEQIRIVDLLSRAISTAINICGRTRV